jgi:predicted CDP-diglyceride synthetase/phosphatidate cytidylyltransferase
MPAAEQTGSRADRLIQWTPFAIALSLVFSMMSDREEWLYVAAVIGGLASIALGRTLGRSDRFSLQARVRKFAKGWVVVVALAALSLLHGKWQPMVFFAVIGVLSSGFFWFGCKSNK